MTHKKQGTSSFETNPLDLARLFENNEQRKVFTEHFLGKPIYALKYGNVRNFNLKDRLLHYFLSYVIIPKYSNHSQINDMHNLDINWALTLMNHMWSVQETNNPCLMQSSSQTYLSILVSQQMVNLKSLSMLAIAKLMWM
ncbi:hypothetical protein Lal_00034020 [Lupinus albus]|nr:hypothetical protein Lal_00034020 [Lupinus albus]